MRSQTGFPEADAGHHPAAYSQEYPFPVVSDGGFYYKHSPQHLSLRRRLLIATCWRVI